MPGRKTVVEQQDAQEFLVLLLDSLHGALLDSQSAEQDDPASNVYYFSDPEDDGGDSATSARANGKAASRSSESSAGRANGHASTSSDGGASEEWTEIGPASRKSVVITTDKTWRDSPVSHVLRGRLRSTIKRRNAKSSISIEPFFSLSLDPLLGVTGAASAGGASALPDKRRPGGEAPSTTLPHFCSNRFSPRSASPGQRHAREPTRSTRSSRRCRRRCSCTLRVSRLSTAPCASSTPMSRLARSSSCQPTCLLCTPRRGAAALSPDRRCAPPRRRRYVGPLHCVRARAKAATKGAAASNSWFLCDDTHVDPITEDAVLASKDTAYLLMYTRV
jgi:hypothetical protein